MDAHSNSGNGTSYSLREIADWQLKGSSAGVTLPDLQRGFVWKPFQTENLWDSLLRRFPVGTFILRHPKLIPRRDLNCLMGSSALLQSPLAFLIRGLPVRHKGDFGEFATSMTFRFFGLICIRQWTTPRFGLSFDFLPGLSRGATNEGIAKSR